MAKLCLRKIMLELSPIGVIVGRIAVDKAIQHDGVEGHPPIRRRRRVFVFMIVPFSPVIEGVGSCLIFIKIKADLFRVVSKSIGEGIE